MQLPIAPVRKPKHYHGYPTSSWLSKKKDCDKSYQLKENMNFAGFGVPCPYGKVGEHPNCYGEYNSFYFKTMVSFRFSTEDFVSPRMIRTCRRRLVKCFLPIFFNGTELPGKMVFRETCRCQLPHDKMT